MPLTDADGAASWNPYEDDDNAVTQDSDEETVVADDEPEPAQGEPEVEPEPETVTLTKAEWEEAQKKLRSQESHIGTLESENKGYRTVLEQYKPPEVAPEPEVDPFDDPGTRQLLQRAYEENPVEAMRLVGQIQLKHAKEQIERGVKPVVETTAQQERLRKLEQTINNELLEAAEKYGDPAREIVTEYATLQGVSGRLAEKILERGKRLQSMGYDPQLAVAPGNFAASIAEIIAETGTATRPKSKPPVTVSSPAKNAPARSKQQETTPQSEEEQYADSIVNAVGVTDKMRQILPG